MATQKTVNYTAEQTAEIVSRFQAGETPAELAAFTGRSVRSIVAKLSREGVYTAKAKAKGEARVKKADLVAQIAAKLGVAEIEVESLEKATHNALELIAKAL